MWGTCGESNLTYFPSTYVPYVSSPDGPRDNVNLEIILLGKTIPNKYLEKHVGLVLSAVGSAMNFPVYIKNLIVRTDMKMKTFFHLDTLSRVQIFNTALACVDVNSGIYCTH